MSGSDRRRSDDDFALVLRGVSTSRPRPPVPPTLRSRCSRGLPSGLISRSDFSSPAAVHPRCDRRRARPLQSGPIGRGAPSSRALTADEFHREPCRAFFNFAKKDAAGSGRCWQRAFHRRQRSKLNIDQAQLVFVSSRGLRSPRSCAVCWVTKRSRPGDSRTI